MAASRAQTFLAAVEPTALGDDHLPVMVVSHERSGTHFLMNAIASCFGYVSQPWLDIDRNQFNINYYHAQSLKTLIVKIAALRSANIMKCHHEFEFFSPIVDAFAGKLHVFYIYRNPADVMASYWRFLRTWHWAEGPKMDTALDFATAQPMGRVMRYQFRQYGSMLDRWANHVGGWTQAPGKIHLVRYEDLDGRYEDTVKSFGDALGMAPRRIVRPSRGHNVVEQGDINFVAPPGADNRQAVADLAAAKYPELLARLGYGGNGQSSAA
jgi:Sulfotransferase domain